MALQTELLPAALGNLASVPFTELLLLQGSVGDTVRLMRRHATALPPGPDWLAIDGGLCVLGRAVTTLLDAELAELEADPHP